MFAMYTFIELKPFADVREKYLDDEQFMALQQYLISNHGDGDVIPRSGGCQKIRWSAEGRGKRAGIRVIYFLKLPPGTIVLVNLYAKNVRETIDPVILKRLKEHFDHG